MSESRYRRDGPFKIRGTLIKSSQNPQYIPRIATPTPTAVSSLTPVPATTTQFICSQRYLGSIKLEPSRDDECDVLVTTDTSCNTHNNGVLYQ